MDSMDIRRMVDPYHLNTQTRDVVRRLCSC